jgi:hypothetical protein
MLHTRRITARAARRLTWRRFVRLAGPTLTIAATLGLALALADRLVGPGLAWWHWALWPALAGLLATLTLTLARRRGPIDAAIQVDTALHLHDRLGTAWTLADRATQDPFAALTVEQAETAAKAVDVRRAVPVTWGRSWSLWPAAAALAAAVGYFVEPMHLLEPRTRTQRIAFNEQRTQETLKTLEEMKQSLEANADEPSSEDAERREVLDRLARELENRERSPDEALASAARALEEAAESAEGKAREMQAQTDQLKESLASLPAESADPPADPGHPAPASGLREALRQGDLASASETLEEIERQLHSMPSAERERLARELEGLADDLRKESDQQARAAAAERKESEEKLAEQGLSEEQAERLAAEKSKEAIKEQLREKGMDEESAERLAERQAEENLQRDAKEKAAEETKRLSDASKQAAEDVRTQPAPEQPPKQDQESPSSEPGQQSKPAPEKGEQSKPSPSGDQNPSSQDQTQTQRETSEPAAPKPQDPSPAAPTPKAPQQSPQQQQQGSQGERKPSDQQPGGEPNPNCPNPQPGPNSQPGGTPSPTASPAPGGDSEPGGRPGIQKMKDGLDQMQQFTRDRDASAQRAKQLRERSQDAFAGDRRRPEPNPWDRHRRKEKGGQGAGRGESDNPPIPPSGIPFKGVDEIDARESGKTDRVAAEWTRPGVNKPDRTISEREFAQQLVEAKEAAEQAVEDQQIPARYRNVREFYQRALKKQAEGSPSPSPPPAEPAPAAEDAKKP